MLGLVGWLSYVLFSPRTSHSVIELVSGIELEDTYNIQTLQDDWADPTSFRGEGVVFFKIYLTEHQCSSIVKEATILNYKRCPIAYTTMGLPTEISGITNGIYRMKIGSPDNRDVDICMIDVANKIMYVYIYIM